MEIPKRADGTNKIKFEVKQRSNNGRIERAIFINNELFDYEIDQASLKEAYKMGPDVFKAVQRDIEQHFVKSICDFTKRDFTAKDVVEATKTGWL